MKIRVKLLKSFTQDPAHGAPVGVIEKADHLTDDQMIAVVKHFDLPECVFLQQSNKAHVKTRFFTRQQEVAYCGHATLAAFKIWAGGQNDVFLQETQKGVLKVRCTDELITLQQSTTVINPSFLSAREIASLLTISAHDVCGPCQIISTGTPKILVPVKNLAVLFAIEPQLDAIKTYCLQMNACGIYPFTQDTLSPHSHFHARQFNPLVGIDEDPITGVAAAALGVYNQIHKLRPTTRCIVEQGHIMNQFGTVIVDVAKEVYISGYAVSFAEKEISV